MSENFIVQHCAPTLAGIKTGNLFTYAYESESQLWDRVRRLNRRLWQKGVRIIPLRWGGKRALIYIYRPHRLRADLENRSAIRLLQAHGYRYTKPGQCIVRLAERLKGSDEFPHEIGLFLGYPPEDVQGFIENRAQGCKCTGCWKVYGDEVHAQLLFDKYQKCTELYCAQLAKGKSIEALTVAG